MSQKSFIDTVDQIINHAKGEGIIQHTTQDQVLDRNLITLENKKLVNFGSCSYLGLEFEETVKSAAKDAIDSYGTQFSSSRAYVSPIFYGDLEAKLSKIFDAPTIVTPTTTLGHTAAIPVLISRNDAVILDHQVHSSIQTAVKLVKAVGTHVEMVRHNRMDLLEEKIIQMQSKYDNIWYMADGIYSMYGDLAPLDEIYALLDKYPCLNFYVDDAHGMSCFGDKGQGYVLSQKKIHERMIVATSFAKAFATGGGALIFPTKELAQKIRNVGGPLITSGPMQPSALGAANRVADMHLRGEIKTYQEDLSENIRYTQMLLKKYDLPNVSEPTSPIFFIAVSLPKVAYNILTNMKSDGYFLNLGIFPAVPIKNTGIRFTITSLHTFKQIQEMIECLANNFRKALNEEQVTIDQIYKAFKIKTDFTVKAMDTKIDTLLKRSNLRVNVSNTIAKQDQTNWDRIFRNHGNYDVNGLNVLERSFTNNRQPEQNWKFYYLTVEDMNKNTVLSTFLTVSLSKDDMLSPREVSMEIEEKRKTDPLFMTSKTLSLGSPVTEGEHLYLDKTSDYWTEAMNVLLELINDIQEKENIQTTILRDIEKEDADLEQYFLHNGFFQIAMPDNSRVTNMKWETPEEFYQQMTKKKKGHFRRNILKTIEHYDAKVTTTALNQDNVDHWYSLYLNVKRKSLDINTFTLPKKYFEEIAENEGWEVLSLFLKDENGAICDKEVAVGFCYKGKLSYSFAMVGIDYDYNYEYGCYRQMLWFVTRRAQELGYENINMGYTSTMEKRHFGAKPLSAKAYLQVKDNYALESLAAMTTTKKERNDIDKRRVLSV